MASNLDRDSHGLVNLLQPNNSVLFIFKSNSGIFIIVVTPARVAQYSYDKARLLAATPFGWLAFGLLIGKSQGY